MFSSLFPLSCCVVLDKRGWGLYNSVCASLLCFPGFGGFTAKINLQGKPSLTDAQAVACLVSAHEFLTLRIPLLAGRLYDDAENMRAAHLAVVNQAFVKQFLGDGNAIEKNHSQD